MPLISIVLSALFLIAATFPARAALFHVGQDECMLIEQNSYTNPAPDVQVRRVHPDRNEVVRFYGTAVDKPYSFHGIVRKTEGARARAKSELYDCLAAADFEKFIHHAQGRIAGTFVGLPGAREAFGARTRFQGQLDFFKHSYAAGLDRLCLLTPILPIGDPVCLRAARQRVVARNRPGIDAMARDRLIRSCVNKESGPACLITMILFKPTKGKADARFDAAARQLAEICDVASPPDTCAGIAADRTTIMGLSLSQDVPDKDALVEKIAQRAFRQIVHDEASFSSRCPATGQCDAYLEDLAKRQSLSALEYRNMISALMQECDFGQNDQRSCRELAHEWRYITEKAHSDGKDPAYVQRVLGGVPNGMDQLIYLDFDCYGKTGGSLEEFHLSSCLAKADILREGIPGLLSPDIRGAGSYYSFICLGTGKTDVCRTACELGVKSACR